MSRTQANTVLGHLKNGRRITPAMAWNWWGISRLASCIYDLRKRGIPVATEMIYVRGRSGKARVARYSL